MRERVIICVLLLHQWYCMRMMSVLNSEYLSSTI